MDPKQPMPATGGEISSRIGIRFYRYRGIIKRYWWVLAITVGLGLVYRRCKSFSVNCSAFAEPDSPAGAAKRRRA